MANRTTIRCNVCGCETAITNIQSGRKVFCLHCGRIITDSYQPGMEYQQGMEYLQNVNYQHSAAFNQPQQPSAPEETIIPPPPPIDNAYSQQGNAPEPPQPQPSWMTEPYIRVNWKRIGYTIKTVFKGVCSFFSKRWADFREGLRSDAAPSTETSQQIEQHNVPPTPDVTSQPQAPEPETPFGYVDRRQARIQQSFSRNFADSGAIPVPPSNPNYSQQRIDLSFSNSFAESGAIPISPSNPNYSQQRIDESFTKSFRENENKQA